MGQGLEGSRNQSRGPCDVPRRNSYARAGFETNRSTKFQPAGTDLWTLKVLKNTNTATFFLRHFSEAIDCACMLLMAAVGEIEAGHLHAQMHEVPDRSFRITGRPERTDDFCLPRSCRNYWFQSLRSANQFMTLFFISDFKHFWDKAGR